MGWEMLPPEKDVWPCVCTNCQKLNERIKVLEDALKQILEYGDRTWKEGIARAALEVKP
jgi:hypothetical protein